MKKLLVLGVVIGATAIGVGVVWLRAAAPGIDSFAASPAYIVINSPTAVLFTARITDPALISTGVNLLRTDATGKTMSTAGIMRDDGQNGDVAANDKTFTLRLSLNQATVGQLYYRVAAAFRGTLQRTLSPVFTVTVDPFPLPPDPGEAGKQTLAGIDSDNDGVRDDVQRYIGVTYYQNPSAVDVLRRYAVVDLGMIVSPLDRDIALEMAARRRQLLTCWNYLFPEDELQALDRLLPQVLNSRERLAAYSDRDHLLSGRTFATVRDKASACQ